MLRCALTRDLFTLHAPNRLEPALWTCTGARHTFFLVVVPVSSSVDSGEDSYGTLAAGQVLLSEF